MVPFPFAPESADNPCLCPQQLDLSDGGGAVVEAQLAARSHLLRVLRVLQRGLETPHADLAVAAAGDDASADRDIQGDPSMW